MTEDLMELISELQERYQIDQEDVDALVAAIEDTFTPDDGGVGEAMADQAVPEEEEEF